MDVKKLQDRLKEFLGLLHYDRPIVALYDAEEVKPFEPLVYPPQKGHTCVFAYYPAWEKGKTLVLTKERAGCGGGGRNLCGAEPHLNREDFVDFLYGDEGLKASRELVEEMMDDARRRRPRGKYTLLGPFRAEHTDRMISVTLFADPDRLAPLITGAHYYSVDPADDVVIAPMGSGCSLLDPFMNFPDPDKPRAVLGSSDMAMRSYLPPCEMTFTMNMPMFYQMIDVDDNHFLRKGFWRGVVKARGWECE